MGPQAPALVPEHLSVDVAVVITMDVVEAVVSASVDVGRVSASDFIDNEEGGVLEYSAP